MSDIKNEIQDIQPPVIHRKKTSKTRKMLKFLFKLSFSLLLIIIVLKEIDLEKFVKQILGADPLYLTLAMVGVIMGQVMGSARMQYYGNTLDMPFTTLYSLAFYFIGTLFNIVLPGGIGGDGYKAYYFQKRFRFPWHKSVFVVLRGRASGLLILCIMVCVLGIVYSSHIKIPYVKFLFLAGLLLVFPVYSIAVRKLLKEPIEVQVGALKYSFIVQLFYLFGIIFILYALGTFNNIMGYIIVFLISNIVAVIPISFGGLGLREFTFIKMSTIMHLQMDVGVAASMLFYLAYTLTSFIGIVPYVFLDKLDKRELNHFRKLGILRDREFEQSSTTNTEQDIG